MTSTRPNIWLRKSYGSLKIIEAVQKNVGKIDFAQRDRDLDLLDGDIKLKGVSSSLWYLFSRIGDLRCIDNSCFTSSVPSQDSRFSYRKGDLVLPEPTTKPAFCCLNSTKFYFKRWFYFTSCSFNQEMSFIFLHISSPFCDVPLRRTGGNLLC